MRWRACPSSNFRSKTMKLYCKSAYHNGPAGLHFSAPGVIEIDDPKAEFLLRDAPENFSRELPAEDSKTELPAEESKALDEPPEDRAVKRQRVTRNAVEGD